MGIGFIASIFIGGFAGWCASRIMKANTGLFVNIVLGIVGATVLNMLLGWLGIYAERSWLPQFLVGAAGATGLIAVYRQIKR